MSLKLFAMPISQPARAVIWLLEWKGVDYETVNTMPGGRKANGTKHPSFLKKFPMVRVVRRSRCSIETYRQTYTGYGTEHVHWRGKHIGESCDNDIFV